MSRLINVRSRPEINPVHNIHVNVQSNESKIMKPTMVVEAVLGLSRRELYTCRSKYVPLVTVYSMALILGLILEICWRKKFHDKRIIFILTDIIKVCEYILHLAVVTFQLLTKNKKMENVLYEVDCKLNLLNKAGIWNILRRQNILMLIFLTFYYIFYTSVTTTYFTKIFGTSPYYLVILINLVHDLEVIYYISRIGFINIRLNVIGIYLARKLSLSSNQEVTGSKTNRFKRCFISKNMLKTYLKDDSIQIKQLIKVYDRLMTYAEKLKKDMNPQMLVIIISNFTNTFTTVTVSLELLGTALFTSLYLCLRIFHTTLSVLPMTAICEAGYDHVQKIQKTVVKLLALPHISEEEKASLRELHLITKVRSLDYSIYGLVPINVTSALWFISIWNTYCLLTLQLPEILKFMRSVY